MNTRVAMDMVQIFIDIGELEQAKGLFEKLPERDKDSDIGGSLNGQLKFAELARKTEGLDSLIKKLEQDANDHQARFDLVICLIAKHDYDSAIENLFTLFEKEPDYKEGAAKEMIITISNLLKPRYQDKAQAYRRRLSNLLAE